MTFELRDHTADVAVEATAGTLADVLADVANGLAAAMCDEWPETGDRFAIEVTAESREALLFDYLDRLIYERDVRGVLPVDHRCELEGSNDETDRSNDETDRSNDETDRSNDETDRSNDETEWTLVASARGVPLESVSARDVKAVTYSQMRLEPRGDGWYAYVVFDV
ncbi:archease [Halopenitus salinus]|uniref:Archease n=1 Tax=Halopenitus salinus TaxID=1198295 RepID=A0ABD5UQX5_9EURY